MKILLWHRHRESSDGLAARLRASTACTLVFFLAGLLLIGTGLAQELPGDPDADAASVVSVRLKDIARLAGVRRNQVVGMGLVVGLDGSGDRGRQSASVEMALNMMARYGLLLDPQDIRLRNAAAVTVTAQLPPFVRPGDQIDVTVSSLGDARSLAGGVLLQTPLVGPDGQVYAVAQGPISVGGYSAEQGGAAARRNYVTVGTIPGGGIVEKGLDVEFVHDGVVTFLLHDPDFATASQVCTSINNVYPGTAQAVDAGAIQVTVPEEMDGRAVEFVAALEMLSVQPDTAARVVVNERTGTVVIGGAVRIAPVAVAHGNLSVRVGVDHEVSQPPPFSAGETTIIEETTIDVQEEKSRVSLVEGTSSVEEIVRSLNAVGASPRDIITILQAIERAGALYGRLEVM